MKVTDPVCGMEIDSETAAGKSEYKGQTYYFCAPGCKRDFDRNPEQYTTNPSGEPRSNAPMERGRSG